MGHSLMEVAREKSFAGMQWGDSYSREITKGLSAWQKLFGNAEMAYV